MSSTSSRRAPERPEKGRLCRLLRSACALADGDHIRLSDLPDYVLGGVSDGAPSGAGGESVVEAARTAGRGLALKDAKAQWMVVLEATYLRELLARHEGNVSAAAKVAGIDRKTFHRLINKYHLK